MNILFRVDSSTQIGIGHIMRCLSLAEDLHLRGANIYFICRDLSGNCSKLITQKGFKLFLLPSSEKELTKFELKSIYERYLGVSQEIDIKQTREIFLEIGLLIDWLIVDHYALDARWEQAMRPLVKKIMAIDDLANRRHECDLLLDQNFYLDLESRYNGILPLNCRKLLGPKYALLRKEFKQEEYYLRERTGDIGSILVFFGGSDPTNETIKTLRVLKSMNRQDIAVDVVVGSSNIHKEEIKEFCYQNTNMKFHCQIDNMAQLMANADLAIGAGGTATWERCFLGLPTIVTIVADNQSETTKAVASFGAIWCLGHSNNVREKDISDVVNKALINPNTVKQLATRSRELMMDSNQTSFGLLVVQSIMEWRSYAKD